MQKNSLILILIIIGLLVTLGLTLWLSRGDYQEYRNAIQELQEREQNYKTSISVLKNTLIVLAEKDSAYSQMIDSLTDQTNEYKAGRKYWFKQHQHIIDSIRTFTIDEQQRYWTERYPPG
jgi:hypothetical protein